MIDLTLYTKEKIQGADLYFIESHLDYYEYLFQNCYAEFVYIYLRIYVYFLEDKFEVLKENLIGWDFENERNEIDR
ncbi:MAG: hypothetical protein KC414_10060 [Romboutsia sp.]|nr:hypothetical protein [Romboutsia sp.]